MSTLPMTCASFDAALSSLRSVKYRPDINVQETPAPQRLAPFSVALSGEIVADDDEIASGRWVLLHDPEGIDSWQGNFRVVTYVKAAVDIEIAADPLLPSVGWAWLREALTEANCDPVALGGTVTRVSSEGFGTLTPLADEASSRGHIEIRASWTPRQGGEELGADALALAELMAQAAGLLPTPVGLPQLTNAELQSR